MFDLRMLCHGNRALASAQAHSVHQAARVLLGAVALAAFVLISFVFCSAAGAQTAHFSWAYTQLQSGSVVRPYGVAVDSSGNVYVADIGVAAVYEMSAFNGVVPNYYFSTSLLGGGFTSPEGLAVDSSGNVYVADSEIGVVKKFPPGCTSSACVLALGGGFSDPVALALDAAGNVYVADGSSSSIKKIPVACVSSSCVKSLGSGFTNPRGVALDSQGDVYVADFGSGQVTELVAVSGSVPALPTSPTTVTLVGSGAGLLPLSVAVSGGNLYFIDQVNSALYQIALGSNTLTQVWSGFSWPEAVAVDVNGNVYMADASQEFAEWTGYVDEFSFSGGNFGPEWVSSYDGSMTLGFTFDSPGELGVLSTTTQGIGQDFTDLGTGTCDSNGMSYQYSAGDICTVNVSFKPSAMGARTGAVVLRNVSDSAIATGCVQGVGMAPNVAFPTSTPAALGGGFSSPFGVAVDAEGNVYAADSTAGLVEEIPVGCASSACVAQLGGGFSYPSGVAVDFRGNVYVADSGNSAIKEIPSGCTSSACTVSLGSNFLHPQGVAVDGRGNVYVADTSNALVKEILAVNGVIPASPTIRTLGSGFSEPEDVAVDGYGNVYVADYANGAVYELLAVEGVVPPSPQMRSLSNGGAWSPLPMGVAVDSAGNVFVADGGNSLVEEVIAVNGLIPTVATIKELGSGFSTPYGVAVDASGNIYVGDFGNHRVAELRYGTPPTLSFSPTAEGSTSSPQTVTVENNGSATLNLLAIGYPDPFIEYSPGTDTCRTDSTVASGATCTLTVDFAPVGLGAFSDSVVLVDDALDQEYAVQEIPVRGFGLHTQAITFTDGLPASANYAVALTYTLSATGGASGNPVVFSLVSGPATVFGSALTITGAGTVVVAANQAGNAIYAAAPQVTQSITIKLASQTITFPAITAAQYAGNTLPLSASASSGLTVSFASSTPAVCTVAGTTASLLISGTCAIQATQTGNTLYAAAPMVQQILNIHHQSQTITFPAITATQYDLTQLPLTATASSGLTVAYTSTTLAVCTVAGSTASLLTPGTCILQANQAGNGTYSAAPQVAQYFTVHLAPQTINFPAITATEYAATTLPLSASATSGLTVVFTSITPTVCTVSGATASLLISGVCAIQATQPGNALYAAAPMVEQTFTVHHQTQTITFPQIASQVVGAQVTLTATASSGLTVAYSVATASATVCSVSGSTATMLAAGTCVIHANQAGNGAYSLAPQVSVSFTVKAD